MFNSYVESLGDDSVSDLLVDDDSERSWVDVEDCSGSAVIELVWHTFVDGTIDDDVNDISDFVSCEIL